MEILSNLQDLMLKNVGPRGRLQNHITFIVTLCIIHTMSNEGKHLLGITLVVSELRIKGAGTLVTRSMVREPLRVEIADDLL